jgi:hypothetical protein
MEESDYLKRPDVQPYLKVCELLRRWDPIGVFQIDKDWSKDEYDGYAPALIRLLDQGADEATVADYLKKSAQKSMGIESNPPRNAEIARELVEYWKSLP